MYPYQPVYPSTRVPYGSLNLTESDPPQTWVDPISLEDAKDFLKLEPTDGSQDARISGLIAAAREMGELFQGRDLVRKQWDLSMDAWPRYAIELRDPLVSVDLMQYTDSNGSVTPMSEGNDYVKDAAKHPGVVIPPYNQTWPVATLWPSSAILCRFTSGFLPTSAWWNDAGARVKLGMQMLVSGWFDNRLPFVTGFSAINEYPYAVTACLSAGALRKVI